MLFSTHILTDVDRMAELGAAGRAVLALNDYLGRTDSALPLPASADQDECV